MYKSVQWRMVTGFFTSWIMWSRSKLCTKTWKEQLWCGAPGISSDHLHRVTEASVPTGVTGWQHTGHPSLTGFLGMSASSSKDSWSMHLSSNGVQAGRHFSRLDVEYSISVCKKEPFSEPGLAKRCRGTRGSWALGWVFCALCSENDDFCPVNWLRARYQELSTALHLQLTGACQPRISLELPQHLQGLNLRPWSPGSNLLKCAVGNATAQILCWRRMNNFWGILSKSWVKHCPGNAPGAPFIHCFFSPPEKEVFASHANEWIQHIIPEWNAAPLLPHTQTLFLVHIIT